MKKKFFHLFLVIAFLIQGNVEAAKLYAFLVCDTHASNIEESVEADYYNMKKELKKICKDTHLKPRFRKFTGNRVSADIMESIEKLKVKEDDVVVFYYSGHGMRFSSQEDPFPVLDFEYGDYVLSQWDITQEIMSKNPRLVLSITDCCNNFIDKWFFSGSKKERRKNLRKLFLDSSGTYIATAAQPGEYSFGLNGDWSAVDLKQGGFYTNAFLSTLKEEVGKENPDINWNLIFELATLRTQEFQMRDEQDPTVHHTPHYLYIP